ncbi:MAG: HAMP domain-containing protein [Chloroflexaceae bacterium]|nr:HAMP domain-containing protein [Chloroflexaceae bacterium]
MSSAKPPDGQPDRPAGGRGSPLSLRTRLALGYTAFFSLIIGLLGTGVLLAVQELMLRDMRQQLTTTGELIQQNFDSSNTTVTVYFGDSAFLLHTYASPVIGLDSPALYVQVRTLEGNVVATSASLHEQQLPITPQLLAAAWQGQSHLGPASLPQGTVLLLTRPLLKGDTPVGVLQVAHPLREVNRTLDMLVLSSAVIGVMAMLAALRGGVWLAGQALRPVGQVAHTARCIVQAEDLSRRVPETDSSDEIGDLTRTINAMLARLEQLFTLQHRFVADVSHELRTPLAAMRGHLDILQRGARHDPQVLAESLTDMQREVLRLTRLTNDLLLLAQADAGRMRLRHEIVALDDLVLDVVRTLHPLCQEVALIPIIDHQVAIIGDEDRLKQALINLVANALSHTPAGGSVTIGLSRHQTHTACLRVGDTGEGISPDDIPYLFDRFYRADKARSRRSGGAGIGLTIVKWVVESHGGQVVVESVPGVGSVFTLLLPIS